MTSWATSLLWLSMLFAAAAGAEPRRVLSLNLCTDQLVLALADADAVVGVTRAARDCRYSAACAAAARVPVVQGTAEEVVALRPDLIVAGESGATTALAVARRLGVQTLVLPSADTLAAIRDQIGVLAQALGRSERGRALKAAFDRRLALVPSPAGPRPVAAIYQPNGFTSGAGSLADAVLARAGLSNYATEQHLGRAAAIPLEYLVLHPPDLLITDAEEGAPSLAESMLWHPALRDAFPARRVQIPASDWICGGPATLDALERLVQARLALPP
jgi:iron complex transport system substrate-binding protein